MQGYLKTAEISMKAYLSRPWLCDNVTGKEEVYMIFFVWRVKLKEIVCLSKFHLSTEQRQMYMEIAKNHIPIPRDPTNTTFKVNISQLTGEL